MPPTITAKRRHPIEPISYDGLTSNTGMSGLGLAVVTVEPPRTVRKGRIRRALLAEDGHSLAEQAIYEALWKAAAPVDEPFNEDRTIRIGYRRLAQMTRLSWVSVKTNLRSLEGKLAIQVIGSENSAKREGKYYRVYSGAAILERRKTGWFRVGPPVAGGGTVKRSHLT